MRPINPLPRGADLQKQKDGLADPEQSPPARGRHLLRVRIDYVAGFIPSEEGQTSSHTLTSHRPTIHPFLRRADFYHKPIDASHIDSSLPTKGSPQNLSRHITAFRFIPSCEGQTHSAYKHRLVRSDSSLLAKGRFCRRFSAVVYMRFIPSCEGQTTCRGDEFHYKSIHPLLRGADESVSKPSGSRVDSSPPTRGRLNFYDYDGRRL